MGSRLVVRLNLLPSDRVKGPWSLTHSGIMIALSSSWSVMPRSWAILFSSSYTVCSTVCMNVVKFFHLAHTQVGSRIFDGREVLESQRVLVAIEAALRVEHRRGPRLLPRLADGGVLDNTNSRPN